jgi:hypothetical protein
MEASGPEQHGGAPRGERGGADPLFASIKRLRGPAQASVAPRDSVRRLLPTLPVSAESSFLFRPSRSADERTLATGQTLAQLAGLLIRTLTPGQAHKLLAEVTALTEDPRTKVEPELYRRLTGEEPPEHGEQVTLRVSGLLRAFERRRRLLADSLGEDDLYRLTPISPERSAGWERVPRRLFAIKDFEEWRFPTFQFDPESPDGTIPGLSAVLAELEPVPVFSQLGWFTLQQAELGGMEPWRALRTGRLGAVLSAARALVAVTEGQWP